MNYHQKYLSSCVLAIAALFSAASFQPALAQTAPDLGAAGSFSVLGGSAVTCTDSVITGDVGVSPTPAFTNARCVINGTVHLNDTAAIDAQAALVSAYSALVDRTPCTQNISVDAFTGNVPALGPLAPGVYCFPAGLAFTDTTLTLDGSTNPNGIWIFKVGAALTGSGFQVVMANGAQPCNVFWAVGADVTLTTSTLLPLFQGNILAGAPTPAGGSITITGGSVVGRALANKAVTMTNTSVGTCTLVDQAVDQAKASCVADADDDDDVDDDHHEKDKHHGKDKHHEKDKDKHHKKHKDRDRY